MKKLLLCAVLLFAALLSNGKNKQKGKDDDSKAITLTSKNVVLSAGTIHEHSASITKVKLPKTGSNATWDYSGLTGGAAIKYGYVKNKDKQAFSKTAVVDTGLRQIFDTYGGNYPSDKVYDEDNKGLYFAGYNTPRFPTYLNTGYIEDSLTMDNQVSYPTKRAKLIKFPATKDSKWHSNYETTTTFQLTLAEIGWYNIKCSEVAYTNTKDEVVGYGDLKIPTTKKKDCHNEFEALMVKQSVLTMDSLFVGPTPGFPNGYPLTTEQANKYYSSDFVQYLVDNFGTAADPYGLFAEFGVSEGMSIVTDYSEIFYTEDAFRPAITFDFAKDDTYGTLAGIVYNTDITGDGDGSGKDCNSVQTADTKYSDFGSSEATTVGLDANFINTAKLSVYPNPVVNSSSLNCSMVKNTDAVWTLNIMNMMGQVVESIRVSAQGKLNIPVSLNGNVRSGLYIIKAIDETGKPVGTTKLNVIGSSY